MATTAATLGPTPHRTLDLDAGTGLPRAVRLAAAVLLIAGIAVLLATRPEGGAPATGTSVAPAALTVPGLRPTWTHLPSGPAPSWPFGPAPALTDTISP